MSIRKRVTAIVVMSSLLSTGVVASHYTTSLPVEVMQQFVGRGPYSRISLVAKMDRTQDVLIFLRVTLDGKDIAIPPKELADVRSPNLASIRLFYDGEDERNVFVRVDCENQEKTYAIQFHLTANGYVDRMVLDDLP